MKKKKVVDRTPRIVLTGEGRDEWGNRYFKFSVRGVEANIPPFSAQEIIQSPNNVFVELSNAGASAFSTSARRELLHQLDRRSPQPPKFVVVTRLGWNRGAFVLPQEIVGEPKSRLEASFRHLDQQQLAKYRVKGTLEDWQIKIGKLCAENSRLMFCASLGLTGPILPLVSGPRSGGFQLFGEAETGKTAAAMVTGSIWGCHRSPERRESGFAENWHTTAGKVEITALAHNETVLILDETKRAGRNDKERAQAVVDISFGLAENVEKERLTNTGSVRGWRLYFLSTSNYSLTELARQGGIEVDNAQRGRFVDIPNPVAGHGIYENLHEFLDGRRFTDALKGRCRKCCGAVGEELVRRLVEERRRDPTELKKFLKQARATYLKAIKAEARAENLRLLNRASGRFATVFAAGSLAIRYKICLWDRDRLLQAILSCQLDGLRAAKTEHLATDPSVSDLRRKLVEYLRERRREFMNLDDDRPGQDEHQFGSVPGYVATFKVEKWFYLTADQLVGILGKGENADRIKKELVSDEMMDRASNGRYLVQRPIFSGAKGNKGHKWVHAFRARLLKRQGED